MYQITHNFKNEGIFFIPPQFYARAARRDTVFLRHFKYELSQFQILVKSCRFGNEQECCHLCLNNLKTQIQFQDGKELNAIQRRRYTGEEGHGKKSSIFNPY